MQLIFHEATVLFQVLFIASRTMVWLISAAFQVMTCEFTLPEVTKWTYNSAESSFNLGEGKLHTLVAFGDLSSDGVLSYHDERLGSPEPVDFKSASIVAAQDEGWLAQVHAVLMVLAWMGCAASGMLMARYYKKTWKSIKPGGKDLWFRLHQLFMGLTVLLTLAGFFVMIAKEGVGPLSIEEIKINPHPAFGITCIVAAVIQPLMAFLRPHPDAEKRWIFNIAHWFVGNVAFMCAIVAIFLGMKYGDVHMPQSVIYVLITYVCFHVFVHLILTFQRCYMENHGKNQVSDADASSGSSQDDWGSGFRKAIAFIYMGLVWVFAFVILSWIINRRIANGTGNVEESSAEPESS